MQLAFQVLSLLKTNVFVSGEQLGLKLQVSRSRIHQAITAIRGWGIGVISVPNCGYRLEKPIEMLDQSSILSTLPSACTSHLSALDVFYSIPSTNSQIEKSLNRGITPVYACLSETQTQGKGRLNRIWASPIARNIYASFYEVYQASPQLSCLSLIMALAVIDAIESLCGPCPELKVKWPNDIWYSNHKVCGILIETFGRKDTTDLDCITGIGINTSKTMIEHKDNQPISLEEIYQKTVSRNQLASNLISKVVCYSNMFKKEGFQSFRENYQRRCALSGQKVSVIQSGKQWEGKCLGINQQGALTIQSNQGISALVSGDIQVRPNETIS